MLQIGALSLAARVETVVADQSHLSGVWPAAPAERLPCRALRPITRHQPKMFAMVPPRRRFSERSLGQQLVALVMLAVSVAVVTVAEGDIQRRPAEQIRGSKLLWRLLSLNALGALGYLGWGRRRA
jgi:hypothetical protein